MKKFNKIMLPIVVTVMLLSAIFYIGCKDSKKHSVTFKIDEQTVILSQSVKDGETVERPTDPVKEGFTFIDWYLGEIAYDFSSPIKSDVTLVAKWDKNLVKCLVRFLNFDGDVYKSCLVEENDVVSKPANPIKEEYNFLYWSLNGEEFDFSSPIIADITLVSEWVKIEKQTYSVTFNTDGAGSVEKQYVKDGDVAQKPNDPKKDGFIFSGWTLNGEEFDFSTPITENIELVANWVEEIVYFNVEFYSDGVLICSKQVEKGETVEPISVENNDGKEFDCWLIEGVEYDFLLPIFSNLQLIAKWKEKEKFDVRFVFDNGEEDYVCKIEENGVLTAPSAPVKEGYLFGGWLKEGNEYNFSLPVLSDFTLTANWIEKKSPMDFCGSWKGVENYADYEYVVDLSIFENGDHLLTVADSLAIFVTNYEVKEIFVASEKIYVVIIVYGAEKEIVFKVEDGDLVAEKGVLGGKVALEKQN